MSYKRKIIKLEDFPYNTLPLHFQMESVPTWGWDRTKVFPKHTKKS